MFKDASKPVERKSSFIPVAVAATAPVAVPDFNSSSSVSITKPLTGGKLSKFGAVKVVKSVNFDEIEAKAKMEREEEDRRGLANKSVSSPQVSPLSQPAESLGFKSPVSANSKTTKSAPLSEPVAPVISKEQQEAMDRLGMGMRKMNISQSVSSASSALAASAKIKQQQGISSEQFSSKNSAAEDSFVNDRLREIDTSKGISSDAFFGRSSGNNNNGSNTSLDDDDFYKTTSSSYTNNNNNSTSPTNSYANLSNSAKDFASKIAEKASTIDIKGMKKSISSAGSRLSAYLQDLQNK